MLGIADDAIRVDEAIATRLNERYVPSDGSTFKVWELMELERVYE